MSEYPGNGQESTKLLCKLENFSNLTKFCRFVRARDGFGINLAEGISDENFKYFGKGLDLGECGLEITGNDDKNKDLWHCFIGVESTGDGAEKRYETYKGIVDAHEKPEKLRSI